MLKTATFFGLLPRHAATASDSRSVAIQFPDGAPTLPSSCFLHTHSSQSRVGTKYKISGSSKILGAGPIPGVDGLDPGVRRLKAGAPKQTTALVPEVLQPSLTSGDPSTGLLHSTRLQPRHNLHHGDWMNRISLASCQCFCIELT